MNFMHTWNYRDNHDNELLVIYCTSLITETTVSMAVEQLKCDEEMVSEEETTEGVTVAAAAPAAASGDSDDNGPHELVEEEEEAEAEKDEEEEDGEEEEDELEDDRQRRYERDFLLSLQFLEQCKQRPPNLMNAEYIRKVYYCYNN